MDKVCGAGLEIGCRRRQGNEIVEAGDQRREGELEETRGQRGGAAGRGC